MIAESISEDRPKSKQWRTTTSKLIGMKHNPPNDGSDGSNSHNHNHNNRDSHNKHQQTQQWDTMSRTKTTTTTTVVANTCFFNASSAYCYWCFFFCTCSVNNPSQMIKNTFFHCKSEENVACCLKMWVFPKIGVPQNGWFIMENPINMDDLGGTTIFGNIHVLSLTPFFRCVIFSTFFLEKIGSHLWCAHQGESKQRRIWGETQNVPWLAGGGTVWGCYPPGKLTYPPKNGILKMIFRTSRLVGYVNLLEGSRFWVMALISFDVCLAVRNSSVFEQFFVMAPTKPMFFGVHVMVFPPPFACDPQVPATRLMVWYGCFLSFLVETLRNHRGFSPMCTKVSLCQEGDSTSIRSRCAERTRKRGTGVGWFGSLVVGGLGRFFSPMCPLVSRGWIGIILTGHENRIQAS